MDTAVRSNHEETGNWVSAVAHLRRVEALRWAGAMTAVTPLIAWAALFGAMFARMITSPSGARAGTDWVLMVLVTIVVASLPLLPIGCAVLVIAFWRQVRAKKAGGSLSFAPLIPLEMGERLGQWVVRVADEHELLICRQPIHRWLWNPVRVVVRMAQGVMVFAAIEAGYVGGGLRGAAIAGAIAVAWTAAWSIAMIETRVRLREQEGTVEIAVSLDPLFPAFVRHVPCNSAKFVFHAANRPAPFQLQKRHTIFLGGMLASPLGLWQCRRLAEEFRVRAGIDSPY